MEADLLGCVPGGEHSTLLHCATKDNTKIGSTNTHNQKSHTIT